MCVCDETGREESVHIAGDKISFSQRGIIYCSKVVSETSCYYKTSPSPTDGEERKRGGREGGRERERERERECV